MQDLPRRQYPDNNNLKPPDDIGQDNDDIKQNKYHGESILDQKTKNHKFVQDIDEDDMNNVHLIANNSFQMRLKVLNMELKAVETYFVKKLIDNENDTLNKMNIIETCISRLKNVLKINNFEVDNDLIIAENLSIELMKKIKKVLNKNIVNKEEVKKPKDITEVPDYRSIVTIRGTKEDVVNCILTAKKAIENGKYDKAERLLLKAERIFPTENARNLLIHVRSVKEQKLNIERIENALNVEEQAYTAKREDSKFEKENKNVVKCLAVFEKAFIDGNFVKAERMLNNAKKFDSSLDIQEKMSLVKAALNNKIVKDKEKEEQAKIKNKSAGEGNYKSMKAFNAGDSITIQEVTLKAKSFNPVSNCEPELSRIRTEIASESKDINDVDKTGPEETVNEPVTNHTAEVKENKNQDGSEQVVTKADIKYAAECLHNFNKSDVADDLIKTENNLNGSETFEPCLELKLQATAEIALMSSTERKIVIPKKVYTSDTDTTSNKEDVETREHYITKAEFVFDNPNLNETVSPLRLTKPNHEITISQTKLSCVENKKQNETTQHIESQRKEANKGKCDEIETNTIIKPPRQKKKRNVLTLMAGGADREKKIEDATAGLKKAELSPTARAKELQNKILCSIDETNIAKPQNNANLYVKTEKEYNETLNHLSHNEKIKDILINPINNTRQDIQNVGVSQPSSDEVNISKTEKSNEDWAREKEAEMFVSLADRAKADHRLDAAYYYLNQAIKKQPNEETEKLLQSIQTNLGKCPRPLSKHRIKCEANKLLVDADDLVVIGDLEKAEFILTVSWDMHKSPRIIKYHKRFVEARLALFKKEEEKCTDRSNHGISKNIFECDRLVQSALVKYEKKEFEEAEELLKKASGFYPCVRITQLLKDIDEAKNTLLEKFKRSGLNVTYFHKSSSTGNLNTL